MTRRRKWSLGTILAAALMTAAFVAGECGGYVHMESTAFLRVYNDSSRPMVNILFDPLVTDWNAYQARELSYLVDCLDARFIYFCARLGLTHFYSLSALLIIMLCVALQQYFLERDFPALPPWLCSAASLCISSSRMLAQSEMHSLQMYEPLPAIRRETSVCGLPQKLHRTVLPSSDFAIRCSP